MTNIETRKVPINRLNPAPYNPRKDLQPTDVEYQRILHSIEGFGYVIPIVWNEASGNVVSGHQVLKILIAKGLTDVDVSVVNLDDIQEKVLNLALNKISGEWNMVALEELLTELSETDTDMLLTGFDEEEIERMTASIINDITENKEISLDNFTDDKFECKCPKCGFVFNTGG